MPNMSYTILTISKVPEAYLGHCQTPVMELYCKNSRLTGFAKETPSEMFHRVLYAYAVLQ